MGRASLIAVLGFIVIFGTVRNNINKTSENATINASEFTENVIAHNIANSAVGYGMSVYSNTGNDSAYSNSDFLGGSYVATFTTLGDTTRLTVTSTFEGESYTSRVDLISTYEFFPKATGGASIGGGSGQMLFNLSDSVLISGVDTNIDGTPGPGPDMAAFTLATPQDSANLAADSAFLVGSPPSEVRPPDTSAPTVQELITHYATIADITLSGGPYVNITWGTETNPVVVYSDAWTRLEGSTTGYGILAIDGSLKMENNTRWYGIVLVNNTDSLAAFNAEGTPEIYGSLMLTADSTTNATMEGSASLYYSTEAIGIATSAFTAASAGNGGGITEMTISETIWYE